MTHHIGKDGAAQAGRFGIRCSGVSWQRRFWRASPRVQKGRQERGQGLSVKIGGAFRGAGRLENLLDRRRRELLGFADAARNQQQRGGNRRADSEEILRYQGSGSFCFGLGRAANSPYTL